MTPAFYIRSIAPIGILYSGSLICSNIAYVYLNVSFAQMLKVHTNVMLFTRWLKALLTIKPYRLWVLWLVF